MTDTRPFPCDPLTAREAEMARAVARGLRNREIAAEFGISEETVKKHLAAVYAKLSLSGRLALAVLVLDGHAEWETAHGRSSHDVPAARIPRTG